MAGKKFSKTELISSIADRLGETKKVTTAIVTAFIEEISGTLKKGDAVSLVGFGTFGVRKRSARMGKNPQTGEKMQIAAKVVPYFKAGKGLKDLVKDIRL